MKLKNLLGWSSALCLGASALQAQEANVNDKVSQQLKEMQEKFEKQQREMRENFEKLVRDQQAQIDALKKQLEASKTNAPPVIAQPGAPPSQQPMTTPAATLPGSDLARPWRPSEPIRFGSAQNYINLSFDALVAAGWSTARDLEDLQLGGHDPKQRGFTVQNLETVFDGKVDPYFRGQANIVLQLDPEGETIIEAEEAYLETMSLPWNLQVKAGQFFTEFGRLNPVHPHAWDFVDQPLVNGRFLGEDGLRNPGARISWLTPTPFYSEFFLAIQNSQGETAHSFRDSHEDEPFFGRPVEQGRVKGLGDMLFVPRYVASFNLSGSQTLVAGASGAFGPNGTGGDTQIYGVDLFWKWKSPHHHAGFPFVSWQTEAMWRRFEAHAFAGDSTVTPAIPPLPRETLNDHGVYSQISYGFKKGWVASLRGDYVAPNEKGKYESIVGLDPERDLRWRISPAITYYPSEFSKIRLQYNYDDRAHIGVDHSIWVQFEFLLGTHAAHKF
jgi:hypothetical protein